MEDSQKRVLNSWKEIAGYLRVSVRTVQAWEAERGLPVKRLPGRRGMVWADVAELDAWRESAEPAKSSQENETQTMHAAPVHLSEGQNNVQPNVISAPTSRKYFLSPRTVWFSLTVGAISLIAIYVGGSKPVGLAGVAPMISPLTPDPGIESHPDLSPDGKQLAFHLMSSFDSAPKLAVQQIEEGARRVLGLIDKDCVPKWSPDGRRIAYARKAEEGFELVTTAPDGSEVRILTRIGTPDGSFRAVNPFMLCWTVEGDGIVFSESPAGKEPLSLNWVSLTSGSRRRLTWPATGSFGDTQPAFSPDGQWMAFVRNPTFARSDILLLPVSAFVKGAAEPKLLHHEDAMIDGLAWLPDSSGLVLGSNRENGRMALWQLNLAAPNHLLHLTGRESVATFPSSVRTPGNGTFELVYSSEIRDVNVRYSGIGGLMTGEPLAPSTTLDFSPQFSPDGSQIAFSSSRSGSLEIWVSDTEGAGLRQVS